VKAGVEKYPAKAGVAVGSSKSRSQKF